MRFLGGKDDVVEEIGEAAGHGLVWPLRGSMNWRFFLDGDPAAKDSVSPTSAVFLGKSRRGGGLAWAFRHYPRGPLLGRQPSLDGRHDLLGNGEDPVDQPMLGLGRGGPADFEQVPVGGRQDGCDDLVGAELLTERRPRGVDGLVEESLLNGDQQVVGEHTKEDVCLDAVLKMVEDRPLAQRAFHVAKSILDAGQQDIEAPCLLGR